MPMTKFFIYLFAIILLVNLSSAATIYGTVYDLSLKKVSNARVEINTSPKQFYVAQNSTYSFNVPNGRYSIKAQLMQKSEVLASVQENITISQDGNYVLDLILFPDIEEGVEDPGIDVNGSIAEETGNKDGILLIVFAVLLVLGIIVGIVYYSRTRRHEKPKPGEGMQDNEDDLWQIIKIIKKEGGRATQKDIRKQIPLSEAKISLMIAELEHKGEIEKIKKGRGNIIILRKK
ncbi:hypothetical protein HYX06_01440 [Candidatus Woesearchaeota archaeon]|nr:hypothetical protein [Candidatus Woesearchaeota archaeon]